MDFGCNLEYSSSFTSQSTDSTAEYESAVKYITARLNEVQVMHRRVKDKAQTFHNQLKQHRKTFEEFRPPGLYGTELRRFQKAQSQPSANPNTKAKSKGKGKARTSARVEPFAAGPITTKARGENRSKVIGAKFKTKAELTPEENQLKYEIRTLDYRLRNKIAGLEILIEILQEQEHALTDDLEACSALLDHARKWECLNVAEEDRMELDSQPNEGEAIKACAHAMEVENMIRMFPEEF